MWILPWAGLVLLASTGTAQAATDSPSGVVEVDLLFPRNETYAPTEIMPIVLGFQNPELAPFLGPSIDFTLWDMNDLSRPLKDPFGFDLRWTNFSSSNGSTFYTYRPDKQPGLKTESTYMLKWTFGWSNCTGETQSRRGSENMHSNSSTWSVLFTTKSGAKDMDVQSISNSCPEKDQGFAFNVTGTHQTPLGAKWNGGDTCGEVATSLPTPNPCRTKVSPAAASSISAGITRQMCEGNSPPADCPPKDPKGNSAPQTVFGSVIGLVVVLGALSQILV